jgi:ferredoxin
MTDRFVVDWIRCDGYGLCGDLVPELIELDEWRYPIIVPGAIPRSQLHDAQRAVDCCPMKALRLVRATDHAERGPRAAAERRAETAVPRGA